MTGTRRVGPFWIAIVVLKLATTSLIPDPASEALVVLTSRACLVTRFRMACVRNVLSPLQRSCFNLPQTTNQFPEVHHTQEAQTCMYWAYRSSRSTDAEQADDNK